MLSQRARPIVKGSVSHEVRLSSLGLQQPGQISIHRIRPRSSSEASGRLGTGGREIQVWRSRSTFDLGGGKNTHHRDSQSNYRSHRFFLSFFSFSFFASSMVHKIPLKVHWNLSCNTRLIMWERGGNVTSIQIQSWLLGLWRIWDNCLMPELPYSPDVSECPSRGFP